MFLGSLRQGGQVDWAPPGTTAQRNEKNSSHGGTSSDQGTALEAKLGDDEEVDVPTHPRLQEWDHRAAPELGDLKTQLFIPKKRSSSQCVCTCDSSNSQAPARCRWLIVFSNGKVAAFVSEQARHIHW